MSMYEEEAQAEAVVEAEPKVQQVDARMTLLYETVGALGGTIDGDIFKLVVDDVEALGDRLTVRDVTGAQITTYLVDRLAGFDATGRRDEAMWVLTTFGECERDVPYSPQRERRNAGNVRELVCNHDPEHVIVLG